MTTKEWLMRAWRIDREIDLLMDARRRAFDRATSTTAPPRDVRVSGGSSGNPMDSYAALSEQIDRRVEELARVKAEVLEAIEQIPNTTRRQLLIERYINCKTMEAIAVEMNYSWRQINRLHGRALQEIEMS